MNISLITLQDKAGRAAQQARADLRKALAAVNAEGPSVVSCGNVRDFFSSLEAALAKSDTIVLAVENTLYLQVKELLLRALGLEKETDASIASLTHVRLHGWEDSAAHAVIARGAQVFASEDGLYSGFGLESAGQGLVFLPLDPLRLRGVLRAGALDYVAQRTGIHVDIDQAVPEQDDFQTYVLREDSVEAPAPRQEPRENSAVSRAVRALLEEGMTLAFASSPTVSFVREAACKAERFDDVLQFSDFEQARGTTHPNEYVAQLAKGALERAGTQLGASISNIFSSGRDADESTFIYVAVADKNAAKVRRLFSEPGEHPGSLIAAAVETLYEMIAQRVLEGAPTPEAYPQARFLEETEKPAASRTKKIVIALLVLTVLICTGVGVYFKVFRTAAETPSYQTSYSGAGAAVAVMAPEETQGEPDATIGEETTQQETERAEQTERPTTKESTPPAKTDTKPGATASPDTQVPPAIGPPAAGTNGMFTFTVYGYGHGVGMSQDGANSYAKSGWGYRDILSHYYPGTQLTQDTSMPGSLNVGGQTMATNRAIAAIVEKEMGKSYHPEALKAQAVAAYTFVVHNNNSVSGVAYTLDPPSAEVQQAVDAVLGQYVTYNGKSISAMFFAMSAGKTTNAATVWGGDVPYLRGGVDSPGDKNQAKYKTTLTRTAAEMQAIIRDKLGITLTGDPSKWFEVLAHDGAVNGNLGYVTRLRVGDKVISGHQLRMNVFGSTVLRSHCFTVSYSA